MVLIPVVMPGLRIKRASGECGGIREYHARIVMDGTSEGKWKGGQGSRFSVACLLSAVWPVTIRGCFSSFEQVVLTLVCTRRQLRVT